jgi:hypothetical protein
MEVDLYLPVKEWLLSNEYQVRAEVKNCDIVATYLEMLIIVELKTVLNLDVILQAADRQRIGDIVYIAVPRKPKAMRSHRWQEICHLLRRLEIGLLIVGKTHKDDELQVQEMIKPQPFDRVASRDKSKKRRLALMTEFTKRKSDVNVGGVNRRPIMTAYKEAALEIAWLLLHHGELNQKQLKAMGSDNEKTYSILYTNHYGWFEPVGKGYYRNTEKGNSAAIDYSKLNVTGE